MGQAGATDSTKAPGSAAGVVNALRFADDGDGRLVLEDDASTTAIPLVSDADERLVLDDAQSSGLKLRASSARIFLYD